MRTSSLWILLLAVPILAAAQGQPPANPAPVISPVRQDILNSFSSAATRSLTLAKAIPQDKLAWRPMEGVRSFNEVFVHMAGSTPLFCSYARVQIPQGAGRDPAAGSLKRSCQIRGSFARRRA